MAPFYHWIPENRNLRRFLVSGIQYVCVCVSVCVCVCVTVTVCVAIHPLVFSEGFFRGQADLFLFSGKKEKNVELRLKIHKVTPDVRK